MTPTKLSDSDKRELIRLYRQSNENTITLAKRYGVSSSTVRRIIQGALSGPEYEFLVQQKQKRLSDRSSVSEQTERTTEPSADGEIDPVGVPLSESVPVQQSASNSRPTIRKRSEPVAELDVSDVPDAQAANLADRSHRAVVTGELKAMLPAEGLLAGEDFSDFEDEDEDDDDEDEDDLDDDFDEDIEDEDSLFEGSLLGSLSSGESILFEGFANELRGTGLIEVLPLSEASLPKICYLVVDRSAELITRPLKAFCELGQIPAAEIREKTLAVFDNHRVARRFATRNQRVFKIPDSTMLQKAAPYLRAKGITRLLIDGQVYSL